MILWFPNMLPELPGRLLTALHRDICRVRSSEWRSPKGSKSWFYSLPWGALTWYHIVVLREMQRRGWSPSAEWFDPRYRGSNMPLAPALTDVDLSRKKWEGIFLKTCPIKGEKLERLLVKWKAQHNK